LLTTVGVKETAMEGTPYLVAVRGRFQASAVLLR
jgi:hypothetical protein